MGAVTPPDYPTLFFFEVGQWWDYAMLLLVVVLLAGGAWPVSYTHLDVYKRQG